MLEVGASCADLGHSPRSRPLGVHTSAQELAARVLVLNLVAVEDRHKDQHEERKKQTESIQDSQHPAVQSSFRTEEAQNLHKSVEVGELCRGKGQNRDKDDGPHVGC